MNDTGCLAFICLLGLGLFFFIGIGTAQVGGQQYRKDMAECKSTGKKEFECRAILTPCQPNTYTIQGGH